MLVLDKGLDTTTKGIVQFHENPIEDMKATFGASATVINGTLTPNTTYVYSYDDDFCGLYGTIIKTEFDDARIMLIKIDE